MIKSSQNLGAGTAVRAGLLPLAALAFVLLSLPGHAALNNYITRQGDKLYDGVTEFRFVGYNMCDLVQSWRGGIHTPDPWEQEDAICAVAQSAPANRGVARPIMISVRKPGEMYGIKCIEESGVYNETVFRGMDKALQLANQYGVRLILPIIGVGSEPRGGARDFATFSLGANATQMDFFTNQTVKQDFKNFLNYLVNRVNVYTGIPYKNDRAILCWELGNELIPGPEVDAWCTEMAAYLKSLDSNHLLMDGKSLDTIHLTPEGRGRISPASLGDPNVDIVTYHVYYSHTDLESLCHNTAVDPNTGLRKPLIFGEFGFGVSSDPTTVTYISLIDGLAHYSPDLHPFLNQVLSDGSSGALLWNMAYRDMNGGFRWEKGIANDPIPYRDFRWPGIAGLGTGFDEKGVLDMVHDYSYKLGTGNANAQGPALPVPDAPRILPIYDPHAISWRGSVGAVGYRILRSNSAYGPFTIIGTGLSDVPSDPLVSFAGFNDTNALTANVTYYKMNAINASGQWSAESNIVCYTNTTPIIIDNGGAGFTTNGSWSAGTSGGYNNNFLHDGNIVADPSTKWAKWTPSIPSGGYYDVFMCWTAGGDRSDAAPLEIAFNGGVDSSKTVNQRINGSRWNWVGTFNFSAGSGNSVKILCTDTGRTISDAVMFVRNDSPYLFYNNFDEGVWSDWTVSDPWNNIETVGTGYDASGDGCLELDKPSGELIATAGDGAWTNYSAEASATILNSSPTFPGVLFRYVDDRNFYMFRVTPPGANQSAQLYKKVNGAFTLLAQTPCSIAVGTKFTLKVTAGGTSLTCFLNGTSVITLTDTNHPKGKVGFRVLSGHAVFGKMIVTK